MVYNFFRWWVPCLKSYPWWNFAFPLIILRMVDLLQVINCGIYKITIFFIFILHPPKPCNYWYLSPYTLWQFFFGFSWLCFIPEIPPPPFFFNIQVYMHDAQQSNIFIVSTLFHLTFLLRNIYALDLSKYPIHFQESYDTF